MNKQRALFLILTLASFFAKAAGPDYTNLVKSSRKKPTSISKLYAKVVGDYRQGAVAHEQLKNPHNAGATADIRLRAMTDAERVLTAIADVVNNTFESLDQSDADSSGLESPEEKDIESCLSQKAYEELRLVPDSGRGFIYTVPTVTHAGRSVLLRYLIDNNVDAADIEAKQALQKEFAVNQDLRTFVQSQIDAISKKKIEQKLLNIFVRCTRDKDADQNDVLSSIADIEEYIEIINSIHIGISQSKKFDSNKILFTKYLDIYSHPLFKVFQELVADYNIEKTSYLAISRPKAKRLERFLKEGRLFREVLFPSITAYGVCDLFLATTRLLLSSGRFDYAKVVKAGTTGSPSNVNVNAPFIKATDIAHPNFEKPVPVSFEFKRTLEKVGVVTTGQNGSGKSFGFKQLIVNLVLAQAYGIVRGRLEFTPMHIIEIQANVSDSDNLSKYMHEVELFKNLIDRIKRLPGNKNSVVLFDESFVSTGSKEAFELLATTARFLQQNPSVMAIYVTHSQQLAHISELESWRTQVEKNIDGTYTSLYKLEPGVSQENNAKIAMYKACGPVFKELLDKYFDQNVDSMVKCTESVNNADSSAAAPGV